MLEVGRCPASLMRRFLWIHGTWRPLAAYRRSRSSSSSSSSSSNCSSSDISGRVATTEIATKQRLLDIVDIPIEAHVIENSAVS